MLTEHEKKQLEDFLKQELEKHIKENGCMPEDWDNFIEVKFEQYLREEAKRKWKEKLKQYQRKRKELKQFIEVDYQKALALNVENAERIYNYIKRELAIPVTKSQSGIYLIADEIMECDCFIAEFNRRFNEIKEDNIHGWSEDDWFDVYLHNTLCNWVDIYTFKVFEKASEKLGI